VLLIPDILVGVEKQIKSSFLRNSQQFAVAERVPSAVFGLGDGMTSKEWNKRHRRAVVKQYAYRPRLMYGFHGHGGLGGSRLRAANSSTAAICSRVTSNHSMISSMFAPASRFSNTADTGMRVSLNTQAPLSLPGTLSTAGHCDQSELPCCYLLSPYPYQNAADEKEMTSSLAKLVACPQPVARSSPS